MISVGLDNKDSPFLNATNSVVALKGVVIGYVYIRSPETPPIYVA
jgi:hypothetical protein